MTTIEKIASFSADTMGFYIDTTETKEVVIVDPSGGVNLYFGFQPLSMLKQSVVGFRIEKEVSPARLYLDTCIQAENSSIIIGEILELPIAEDWVNRVNQLY